MGEFRRDLYFRLNVLHIELPPLRERKEDIPLLVSEFIQDASTRHDRPFLGISDEAMRILEEYDWPGNVRELRNLVESMVVLAPGTRIEAKDIPGEVRYPRSRGLLPAPIPRSITHAPGDEGGALRPELEFVFRTLVNLRMDIDDLRRDFERYRREEGWMERDLKTLSGIDVPLRASQGEAGAQGEPRGRDQEWPEAVSLTPSPGMGEAIPVSAPSETGEGGIPDEALSQEEAEGEEDQVVYRAGMTMDEMEKEAIALALKEVGGNRRKAAEQLQIGERTLYRKIKKYGLEE